jgi:hypothetical protein
MTVGELSDAICNRLDQEITMVTISSVPWCVDNTRYHFVLIALNHFNIRITGATPKLDTITPNWTYTCLYNISILWIGSSELRPGNQFIFLNLMLNSSLVFLICSFHRNFASRVIPRYFDVLAYVTCIPLMKIGCGLIFLSVKLICTDVDSLSFIRHFFFCPDSDFVYS